MSGIRYLVVFTMTAVLALGADSALRVSGAADRDGVERPALTLTLEAIQALPHVTVRINNRGGKERAYEGVLLFELLKRAQQPTGPDLRGTLLARYVLISASDGYRAVYALPELDPDFSDQQVVLADRVDGQPLPAREGPLRIVATGDKREARWIRMVDRIQILSSPEPIR